MRQIIGWSSIIHIMRQLDALSIFLPAPCFGLAFLFDLLHLCSALRPTSTSSCFSPRLSRSATAQYPFFAGEMSNRRLGKARRCTRKASRGRKSTFKVAAEKRRSTRALSRLQRRFARLHLCISFLLSYSSFSSPSFSATSTPPSLLSAPAPSPHNELLERGLVNESEKEGV